MEFQDKVTTSISSGCGSLETWCRVRGLGGVRSREETYETRGKEWSSPMLYVYIYTYDFGWVEYQWRVTTLLCNCHVNWKSSCSESLVLGRPENPKPRWTCRLSPKVYGLHTNPHLPCPRLTHASKSTGVCDLKTDECLFTLVFSRPHLGDITPLVLFRTDLSQSL